jgi:hypothetical protein
LTKAPGDRIQVVYLDLRVEPLRERESDVCGLLAFAKNAAMAEAHQVRAESAGD